MSDENKNDDPTPDEFGPIELDDKPTSMAVSFAGQINGQIDDAADENEEPEGEVVDDSEPEPESVEVVTTDDAEDDEPEAVDDEVASDEPAPVKKRKRLPVVIGGIVAVVAVAAGGLALYNAVTCGPSASTQISQDEWLSAAYEGENLPGSDFEVVADKPIYSIDGHDCFWASKGESLFISCDWNDDGVLKNDGETVSADILKDATPTNIVESGQALKIGTIQVDSDTNALAFISTEDGSIIKAITAPGSLKESQKYTDNASGDETTTPSPSAEASQSADVSQSATPAE